MELRQLRYFVTLSEELHFGRAAAREHIVPSALSQQVRRLEHELRISLVERSTHHVRLTSAGEVLAVEALRILTALDRVVSALRSDTSPDRVLRVAVGDVSLDTMTHILRSVQHAYPDMELHQVEAGLPEQYRLLATGELDIGIGCASLAAPGVASELVRQDRFGVLFPEVHPWVTHNEIPVSWLARERLLMAEDGRAPEFNQLVVQLCRAAGFTPTPYRGTVQSVRAAAELVRQRRCVACAPRSCGPISGVRWLPLTEPAAQYPWSIVWRSGDERESRRAVVNCARMLARTLGWLDEIEPDGWTESIGWSSAQSQ
jgi:DNA-binding transcriptional LysR family regulator